MASHLGTCAGASSGSVRLPVRESKRLFVLLLQEQPVRFGRSARKISRGGLRASVSNGGDSYLDMWKRAVEKERRTQEFLRISENTAGRDSGGGDDDEKPSAEELKKRTREFQKILEVPTEERDRVQRMQVIDRAAAAIAAAKAILKEGNNNNSSNMESESGASDDGNWQSESTEAMGEREQGMQSRSANFPQSDPSRNGIPGPDFWSWTPPLDSDSPSDDVSGLQTTPTKFSAYSISPNPIMEKDRSLHFLSIPFESKVSRVNESPTLPPFQSSLEVEKMEASRSDVEAPSMEGEKRPDVLFHEHATEAAHALNDVNKSSPSGVNPDGSRWWKKTGIEQRPDGVICRWTMTRGVSADKAVEWQELFWEAADELGYKELGSEKSGRDAIGNVWREFWRESMRQEGGLMHIEKTADKWGKNGIGEEWQEKWWEHYDASGQAEKWAHKWCSIDPNTPLEPGHAHIWHERWGEQYDGKGGSIKYTDKWAERSEGDGWSKWGDKWDENFDLNGLGVKQGETWWEGKHGERWNRTWGEQHNGSGWVHKYGKSSSGEHWDTHVEEETWYERFPHYGFYHCYENSVQLKEVQRPSDLQEEP
ncbi:hypothetical protein L6164_025740 [Bauhinia variegata]|uniref:Uncharacterized protein n=1 Tax=Bauhinia variegata TaxID=167791 RepID=A0ACB9M2Y8_BAUVA|nr:hypothetical protein L6164_025740 [Bauhinia variegata]